MDAMVARSLIEKMVFYTSNLVGRYVPAGPRRWLATKLYPPGAAKPKMLVIDIVGSCNLRCPSCPVGNTGIGVNPVGVMNKDHFREIIEKAKREHGVKVVLLYNWTEPFLHPELPGFIRIVKDLGLICSISTNLNKLRNVDAVLTSGPNMFRVSLSGFTQETYGKTHVRGDIERVKDNMRELRDAMKRTRARTIVEVYYHKYLHNLEEVDMMRDFSQSLGFTWLENWAYYMPMEKVVQFTEGQLSVAELDFLENRLALPIGAAIEAAREHQGSERCSLLEDQIVVDHVGNVNLCCTVYDYNSNRLGSFMNMSAAEIEASKRGHKTCDTCVSKGLQKYFNYVDSPELVAKYDSLAKARVEQDRARHEVAS